MFEGLLVAVLEADDEREELGFRNVGERFLDIIRQSLGDRAEVGVYVVLVARHVAEVRQEHVVGALVEAVLHRAVSDLRGEAVGALGPGDAFMRHFCGEEGLDPEFVEKPGVQGIERMYRERARDADGVVASGLECGAVRSAFDEEKVLPFFDIVEYRDVLDGFPHVRVFVAAAAEVVGMAVDLEHLDRAEIVARFTGEHPLIADLVRQQLRDVEVGFLEEVFGVFLLGEHGDAETAHQLGRRGDEYFLVEHHREGQRNGRVLGDAALEEHLPADGAVADDPVQVIGDDRDDDARGDVFAGGALLHSLADVGIDESRAVLAELERRVRGECDRADVLRVVDRKVACGGFLEEGAGTGRAGLVHRVVDGNAVLQEDVFRVLSADLEDRLDFGIEVGGADRMGDDLVVHAGRFEIHAEDFAGGSGRRAKADFYRTAVGVGADFFLDDGKAFLDRLDRVAVGTAVMARDDHVGFRVDEASLGGGRAAVDAEKVFPSGNHGGFGFFEETDLVLPFLEVRKRIETYGIGLQEVAHRGQRRTRTGGKEGRAESFENGSRVGHDEIDIRRLGPDKADYVAVEGYAAGQDDGAALDLGAFEEVDDLGGHDVRQGQHDVVLGRLALVQAVGTVAFHEYGTPGRKRHDAGRIRNRGYVGYLHVHAAQLLFEELARTGSAFIARKVVDYLHRFVERIDGKILAAHADDRVRLQIDGPESGLHAQRLERSGRVEQETAFVSGNKHGRPFGNVPLAHRIAYRQAEIALVRRDGLPNRLSVFDQNDFKAG